MSTTTRLSVLLLAGALGLGACGSTSSTSAAGTWGEEGESMPHLVLAEDGTLSGTDGCNRLIGSWEEEGDTVEFGELGATMMFCDGVDTWLSGASSAVVEGDTLRVLDADGTEIGTLQRN